MTGSLSGVRVIDMTAVYSGPMAASILGDQGADVVKVEPPRGDMQRGPMRISRNGLDAQFATLNRNKRSIVIDLSKEAGKSVLHRFVASADILMENYRPGVMERLGLAYESLSELNPRLIYASINGVGSTGPYAGRRVYDAVIQAISGIASLQADPTTGEPSLVNTLICDKVTAMTAAQAICSALYAREQTGAGQRVDVSMLDSALFFLWPDAMAQSQFVGDDVDLLPLRRRPSKVKKTADGYIATMPVQTREWEGVFRALELTEVLSEEEQAVRTGVGPMPHVMQQIDGAYGRFTTDELCDRLERHQVPFAKINRREEVVDDPQVKAMQAVIEFEHPVGGEMRQARPPGRFSDTPAGLFRHTPGLGEHTDELLGEIGFSPDEIARLRDLSIVF